MAFLAYRVEALRLRPSHGAQHATRKRVTGKLGQQLAAACIDGNVTHLGNDVGSIARDMLGLAEQGQRLKP